MMCNGKLYWGPLWDFDFTMGLLYPETEGFNQSYMPWLSYLREYDPAYQQMLRDRWEVLDGILEEILRDGGVLDQYILELEKSAEDDEIRWDGWKKPPGRISRGSRYMTIWYLFPKMK